MTYRVQLLTPEGRTAGYLARGERNGTKLCGSVYKAYHYLTAPDAEQAAHHFCQEVKGVAVDVTSREISEFDFTFRILEAR